jgi:3-oxoacyl-[acyl-carrier-protein] synthase II
MKQRVAITGMGVVSPIGNTVADFRDNLLAGVSGIGPITCFNPADLPTRIAGEVKWDGSILRDRKVTFALEAASQCMEDAGALSAVGGLSLGIGLELFSLDDMAAFRVNEQLPKSAEERMTFLQTPSDLTAHLISHQWKLTAPPLTQVSACAAGADALGAAHRLIARGERRWMLAGGSDSMVNPMGVGGFCKLTALSRCNDEPQKASRPFDRQRDGFVLGEGAAMLLLENWDDAQERGAAIHGEMLGSGNSFDAHGISEPHPEGRGACQAMRRALADAGLEPEQVDTINAHGTSTPKNDPVETAAIKTVLGEHSRRIPISATKSMTGHLISAAGALEAVATVLCLQAGQAHPTLNLNDPDPECDLDYVPHRARPMDAQVALSNAFGFGGQNSSFIIRKNPGP